MLDSANHPTERPVSELPWWDAAVDWCKRHVRSLLIVGAVFQIVVLVGMIALRMIPLLTGETILVRVVPIDPRDLFRGEHVILSYEFSRMPHEGVEGLHEDRYSGAWEGRTVYVSLVPEEDGVHWKADKFSVTKPTSGKFIRGIVTGWGQLDFGIEAFYLQEGEGRKYEEAVRNKKLSAEIALTSGGQAALKGLKFE